MKKILAIILAFAMLMSFCACSSETEEPVSPETSAFEPEQPEQEEPSPEEEPEEEPEQEEGPEPEAAPEPDEEFVPARGTVESNVYKNEAFGVSFTAKEDWYYYTDEELAQVMGVAAEDIFTEDFRNALAETELIYDMYCADLVLGSTVNVIYENLGLVYGTILNEESYLAATSAQLGEQFANGGLTLVKCESGTTLAGGKEVSCLNIIIDLSGVYFYETVVVKEIENWMCIVTMASLDEAVIAENLANLSFEG